MPKRASLFVIFLTVFIDLLGFGMVLPLLPLYARSLASDYQLTPAQVGWTISGLMASFSLMQFLFSPVWGRLSDRYGRRPILMIGLGGSVIFYAIFGLATSLGSLVGMFISRVGAGIAGATISTAQAYIADATTKENRAKGMALIGAAFAGGFTFGPLLGAVALSAGDNAALSEWPGYLASILSAGALALAYFKLPESLQPEERERARAEAHTRRWIDFGALRDALNTPSVGLLLLTSFISVLAFAKFESTISLLLADEEHGFSYDTRHVFYAFAYIGVILTLAQGLLVRRLSGKVSEGAMASSGAVLQAVGFALLIYTTNASHAWSAERLAASETTVEAMPGSLLALLLVSLAAIVVGFALITPSLQSLISRRSDPAKQGGILGVGQSVNSLARIVGPAFGPRLFVLSAALPSWVAGGLTIVCLGLILLAARRGADFPGPESDRA